MQISRADQSLLAQWWFTVDRLVFALVGVLIVVGLVLLLASSPPVALRKGLAQFHFVERQVVFAALGVGVMATVSLLSVRQIRRLALVVFLATAIAMIGLLLFGEAINGAKRWIRFAGFSLQPSEFAKPAFVVLSAWAFAEQAVRRDMPALPIAIGLFAITVVLMALQPDMGQALLVTAVWGALFLMAGFSIFWMLGFSALVVGGSVVGYLAFDHVRWRVDAFVSGTLIEHSQTERAYRSFIEGGLFGRGPGEGTIKTTLPDAHTDFIFAVVAEEHGVLACLGIIALFMIIIVRILWWAIKAPLLFQKFAVAGLALLIGLQAFINMSVSAGLLPAKGMTLPLISAGGSSMVATCLTFGMILGLMRDDPRGVFNAQMMRETTVQHTALGTQDR